MRPKRIFKVRIEKLESKHTTPEIVYKLYWADGTLRSIIFQI